MRIAALIFGLLGTVGSGFLGAKWQSDIQSQREKIELARKLAAAVKDPETDRKMAELDRLILASYGLIGGAVLGLVGVGLVFARKGMIAGIVFLIAFGAPIALARDPKMAIFSFGLAVGALFAFFVKPGSPYKAPKGGAGLSEDMDFVG